MIIKKKTR